MTDTSFLERAIAFHRQGNLREAEALYQQWLEVHPNDAEALHFLGLVLAQSGRSEQAVEYWQRAAALAPHRADVHNNLGEALRRAGRLEEALRELEQATSLAPAMVEARFNLANTVKELDRLDEAVALYRQVVAEEPAHAKTWFNLGNTLREQGKSVSAKAAYVQALQLRGNWPEVLQNLGAVELQLDEVDLALKRFELAAQLRPESAEWDELRGLACQRLGRTEEARAWYAQAQARSPHDPWKQLRAATLVAPVAASETEIEANVARVAEALEKFSEYEGPRDFAALHTCGVEPPMALAYQCLHLKELWSRYGDVMDRHFSFEPPPPGNGMPHLGIVVTNGHEGVFAACFGGIARQLAGPDLEVSIVCSQATANTLDHLCGAEAFRYVLIPARLDQAASAIRAAKIDALYYWELGTDATNYFLPYFRAARLQIAGWGWPVSSGIPTVDCFLSCASLEPQQGASDYRERLHLLRNLPTSYGWEPAKIGSDDRASFGLAEQDHVYLCHQNVRKWHPGADELLEQIVAADPQARLVLLGDKQPAITQLLLARLQRTAPTAARRAVVTGFLEKPRYLALVKLADVILDTRPYGGGANTIYDAIIMGTPFVTWPEQVHRGRWAAAALSQLQLPELVATSAEQFVDTSKRLGVDKEFRKHTHELLRQRGPDFIQSRSPIVEHREYFQEAIARSRRPG